MSKIHLDKLIEKILFLYIVSIYIYLHTGKVYTL